MLRITPHISPFAVLLQVEGTLSGPWVKELQIQLAIPRQPVALDLSGVSYIDAEGTALIEQACAAGVTITAASQFVSLMLQKTAGSSAGKEG
jgi:hypothetical protein